MHQLIYMSAESRTLSEQALAGLLDQARSRNEAMGITGLLLYRDGFCLQLLEGEQAAVELVYRSISMDVRHAGLYLIEASEVSGRRFTDWRMGYRNLSGDAADGLPGAGRLLVSASLVKQVHNHRDLAVELLEQFSES